MHVTGVLLMVLCRSIRALPAPVETLIIQVQQRVMVGNPQVTEQVLLNGVSLTGTSPEVTSIIRTLSADPHLLALLSINQTAVQRNRTVLRSRECILEGSQVHWTDRVFCDGKAYLTLDDKGAWSAQVPQAVALKALWEEQVLRAETERSRIQEGCIRLLKELRLSKEQSDPGIDLTPFLIPILAILAFMGFVIVSFLLYKNQRLGHAGGVIGSVVHYPTNMAEMAPETKGLGYHAL